MSSVFAFIGLMWLSFTQGYAAFAAAFVFAVGVCYFWPTMLGFVSEYIPKSGALGLNIMGGAGMLSVAFILPIMGSWYDDYKVKALKQGFATANAELQAGRDTLQIVAIIPLILMVAFAFLYFRYRKRPKEELEVKLKSA